MKNEVERFKFFSIHDMSLGFLEERISQLTSNISFDGSLTIIDILEYYNIKKLLEQLLKSEIEEQEDYRAQFRDVSKLIHLYFSKISKEQIKANFDDFSRAFTKKSDGGFELFQYFDDYLECFEKYNFNEIVEKSEFIETTGIMNFPIRFFIETKFFSVFYPDEIEVVFFNNSLNFELILQEFSYGHKAVFLPKAIDKEKFQKMCEEYIEKEEADLGCLQLIYNRVRGLEKYLEITPKLRLMAKERYDKLIDDDLRVHKICGGSTEFAIFTDYDDYNNSKLEYKSLLELRWLNDNNDKYSLLSYIRTFNNLFTHVGLIGLCSFPNMEMGIFEKNMNKKTNHHYQIGELFSLKNCFVLTTLHHYQQLLKYHFDTSIEELLGYYYNEYILEEYGVEFLEVEFPDSNISLKKKTQDMFIIDEAIKTQWNLYAENMEVNSELFELSDTPMLEDLKSLFKDKYYVLGSRSDDQMHFMFLLFSDQAGINYVSNNKKANNFFELLSGENVYVHDYKNHRKRRLDFLIENNIVSVENHSVFVTFKQKVRIWIYREIYYYGSFNADMFGKFLNEETKTAISSIAMEMIEEQLLIGKNTLLTAEETDYFSYVLNNKKFDNALALRNKYSHGSTLKDDEEDYIYSLLVLVLFALKIDQEFITRVSQSKS